MSLSQSFVKNTWIQDGRIHNGRMQDASHHKVQLEWMILSQIELVSVRVRVEGECFWVNLREDNKVSESQMAVAEYNMAEFKMVAIIKLSQNEWVKFFMQMVGSEVWVKYFSCQWWDQSNQVWVSLTGKTKMAEYNMAEFKMAAIIKLSQNEQVKVVLCKMSESKMAEFKMAAIIKFSQNEWVWVQLN